MVVTRSRTGSTKKTDTKVTEIETERASKQTRKIKDRTNWAVMEIAHCIFLEREKHPHINIGRKTQASEVTKSREKEWISMSATEKAPYVTQAEKRLVEFVEAHQQKSGTTKIVASKNAVKHKVAKRASRKITAESSSKGAQGKLMESACSIFMSEYFKNNPDLKKKYAI